MSDCVTALSDSSYETSEMPFSQLERFSVWERWLGTYLSKPRSIGRCLISRIFKCATMFLKNNCPFQYLTQIHVNRCKLRFGPRVNISDAAKRKSVIQSFWPQARVLYIYCTIHSYKHLSDRIKHKPEKCLNWWGEQYHLLHKVCFLGMPAWWKDLGQLRSSWLFLILPIKKGYLVMLFLTVKSGCMLLSWICLFL